jgi:LysM repeat protein
MGLFVRSLVVIGLAGAVIGGGGYATYRLYILPEIRLKEDIAKGPPPLEAPPDEGLPHFTRCEEIERASGAAAARKAYAEFLVLYPESGKVDEVRTRLGRLNVRHWLSGQTGPEKSVYVVQAGDVLKRVAARNDSTVELIFEANRLHSLVLQKGQRLVVPQAGFSAKVDRKAKRVLVYRRGQFFCQYPIRGIVGNAAKPVKPGTPPVKGKVSEGFAWKDNVRVGFLEKGYRDEVVVPWLVVNPSGNTLFAEVSGARENTRPPSGYELELGHVRELSAFLRRGDEVLIQ